MRYSLQCRKILPWAKDQNFKYQNFPEVGDTCFVSETYITLNHSQLLYLNLLGCHVLKCIVCQCISELFCSPRLFRGDVSSNFVF